MVSEEEFSEIERFTWSAVLYPDGTMKRVNDLSVVICSNSKIRLTGYRKDRIIGPAVQSPQVKQLLQKFSETKKITKEDISCH